MTVLPHIVREPGAEVCIGPTHYRHVRTLKDDFFAESHLLEAGGKLYVLKISRIRWLGRKRAGYLSRYVAWREHDIYARVDGIIGVPPLVGKAGDSSFIHEFVPGETLDNRREVDDLFFDRLFEIVRSVHSRGVAYVDLAKKENVIVGDDGRPYLIDFQISMAKSRGRGPFSMFYNAVLSRMMREDLAHVLKHKRKVRPDLLTEEERAACERKSIWSRLHQCLLRKPFLAFKRTFIAPKHGDV